MTVWIYFFITLVIELPIVYLFYRNDPKAAMIVGFLLNLFTWPLLHLLLYSTDINLDLLELGVALTEGIGYSLFMKGKWYKGFVVSFIANGVSYGLGLLLNNWIS
jgi:hypothetical protein